MRRLKGRLIVGQYMSWNLPAYVILLMCSGLVSGSETALFALNRQALLGLIRTQKRFERLAYLLMKQPRLVLMTVLITNTAINVAIFAISFVAAQSAASGGPLWTAAAGMGTLLLVTLIGEIIPKALAYSSAARFAPAAAPLILFLQTVLSPIRFCLGTFLVVPITRLLSPAKPPPAALDTDELRFLVEQSAKEGVIDSSENAMLQAVVALPGVKVREIMVPRVDMESIALNDPPARVRETLRATHRRKLPVCGRDPDDVVGLLYTRDAFLKPNAAVRDLIRPVRFVPEQADLSHLMQHFRQTRTQFAIVVDEYGGTAGLVSVEDVLEQIVGEISESDQPREIPPVEEIDENTYRLLGDLNIRAWKDQFAVGQVDGGIDTLGGLILARLGRLPREGDCIRIRNLTLTVERMRGRRVETVLLRRERETADAPTEAMP